MIEIIENMPGGAYRKAIYECITSTIKRDLTNAEHKYLSHILKLYVEAHVKRREENALQKKKET